MFHKYSGARRFPAGRTAVAQLCTHLKARQATVCLLAALIAVVCAPAHAAPHLVSMTPNLSAPQPIGTPIVWTVTATDTHSGALTFQFNVATPGKALAMVRDFNVGTLASGEWTSQPFAWAPTSVEGTYQVQVLVKNFNSGESVSHTAYFQVTPLVTGSLPVVVSSANPLVAFFSAPSCAAGSSMRVWFQEQSGANPPASTSLVTCHPPTTMTFEIAGMYPTTTYNMYAQTITGGKGVNGPTISFTTSVIPTGIPYPTFKAIVPAGAQSDAANPVLFISPDQVALNKTNMPAVATDLAGYMIWYYYPTTADHFELVTRPLQGGTFISIQNDTSWNPASVNGQVIRQVDLAGNIIRETNTGIMQQELLALGAKNAGPCDAIASPAPVGAACLGSFHHDAIQTLPNGQTAMIVDVEKIFPAGTQGDTSGLPVDIVGDMIIVLDTNWQAVWYFDSFQHDSGGMQLNINRPAVLGETCVNDQPGCPPIFLLGAGIAPLAKDWLHANSLYYEPQDGSIIWSSRHQDWIMKVDYASGTAGATGNILWRMGQDGDFTFNNVYNDSWPWFSHQHEAALENGGLGPMTLFDNGNTRVSPPPTGLGSGDSRGMSLTVQETCSGTPETCTGLQVTPILSVDLGIYSEAMGSAQLESDNNYFFLGAIVPDGQKEVSYSIEILPTSGTDTGTQVFNLMGPESYRAWRVPTLYQPPIT
jgi:arylsulfate sulfotransferase